ncbi:MAG: class A beta-lactamase [Verrucomicrobiota bacterium]|nr:class A beta-lactamase [Verrucomicrobiota bacterium]
MVAALLCATLLATAGPANRIAEIEKESGGRVGVVALDTADGKRVACRADERFAMCSTFKLLAAAAVLKRVDAGEETLARFLPYRESDLQKHAPVAKEHVNEGGMKLGDLCAAALQESDNTAANLLLISLGGPAGLTKFVRMLGDQATRCDRLEPELNEFAAGDERDTTTPAAMCRDLQTLFLGDVLSVASRHQLEAWLAGNQTGFAMIRTGVPKDWKVGDKTGRGDNGATNDIAILRPPGRAPILLTIYTDGSAAPIEKRVAVIAEVTRVVAEALGK